jgi:type VI protein secretion system component VasK
MRRTIIVVPQRLIAVVFSPANRRFSLLVIAAVAVCAVISAAVVVLEIVDNRPGHAPGNCGGISRVIGFGGLMLGQIFLLLRVETRGKAQEQQIAKTRHDLKDKIDTVPAVANAVLDKVDELDKKTNGHLAESIRVVADEIRKAERDQVLTDPRMVAAVRVLVTNIVREVCAERERDK